MIFISAPSPPSFQFSRLISSSFTFFFIFILILLSSFTIAYENQQNLLSSFNFLETSFPLFSPSLSSSSPNLYDVFNISSLSSFTTSYQTLASSSWTTISLFEEKKCSKTPVRQVGISSNTCYSLPNLSLKYYCDNTGVYMEIYPTSSCNSQTKNTISFLSIGCNADQQYKVECSYNQLPIIQNEGEYAVIQNYAYNNANCNSNPIEYFTLLNNRCIDIQNNKLNPNKTDVDITSVSSVKISYPLITEYYKSSSCGGNSNTYNLPTTCTSSNNKNTWNPNILEVDEKQSHIKPYQTYLYNSNFTTVAPSRLPTRLPTSSSSNTYYPNNISGAVVAKKSPAPSRFPSYLNPTYYGNGQSLSFSVRIRISDFDYGSYSSNMNRKLLEKNLENKKVKGDIGELLHRALSESSQQKLDHSIFLMTLKNIWGSAIRTSYIKIKSITPVSRRTQEDVEQEEELIEEVEEEIENEEEEMEEDEEDDLEKDEFLYVYEYVYIYEDMLDQLEGVFIYNYTSNGKVEGEVNEEVGENYSARRNLYNYFNTVDVTFNVDIPNTASLGYYSGYEAYENLANTLSESLDSSSSPGHGKKGAAKKRFLQEVTKFTSTLRQASEFAGSDTYLYATVQSPGYFSSPKFGSARSEFSSNSNSSTLDKKSIIGISVGIPLGVILIAILIYLWYRSRIEKSNKELEKEINKANLASQKNNGCAQQKVSDQSTPSYSPNQPYQSYGRNYACQPNYNQVGTPTSPNFRSNNGKKISQSNMHNGSTFNEGRKNIKYPPQPPISPPPSQNNDNDIVSIKSQNSIQSTTSKSSNPS